MLLNFCIAQAVSFLKPPFLSRNVAGHQNDRAEPNMDAGFKEQRGFINHKRRSGSSRLCYFFLRQSANPWMGDGFQLFSCIRLIEDKFSQFFAIQRLVRLQDLFAEGADDLIPGRLMRLYNLARKRIGIDDFRPESPENSRDSAFTRGNTAG